MGSTDTRIPGGKKLNSAMNLLLIVEYSFAFCTNGIRTHQGSVRETG